VGAKIGPQEANKRVCLKKSIKCLRRVAKNPVTTSGQNEAREKLQKKKRRKSDGRDGPRQITVSGILNHSLNRQHKGDISKNGIKRTGKKSVFH